MNRSAALVALLALSWSHVAGLRCDMGAGAISTTAAPADSPPAAGHTHGGHGGTPADAGSPARTPHPPNHGGGHGCLMIMACSAASVRPARTATMIRIPTVFVRAPFPAPPLPATADLAVETPPPRRTV